MLTCTGLHAGDARLVVALLEESMTENVGKGDAAIRFILGIALFVVAAFVSALPALSLVAALGGIVMAATALTRKCPLYTLFGLDTCKQQHPQH